MRICPAAPGPLHVFSNGTWLRQGSWLRSLGCLKNMRVSDFLLITIIIITSGNIK